MFPGEILKLQGEPRRLREPGGCLRFSEWERKVVTRFTSGLHAEARGRTGCSGRACSGEGS